MDETAGTLGRAPALQPVLDQRLRALRRSLGLSLAEAAERTGISASFLSLVENGGSDITIGRLLRLVDSYETSIADLLGRDDPLDGLVVRSNQRRVVSSENERITVHLLTPDNKRKMSPLLVFLEPGGESAEHLSHEGEEWTHVIAGRIELDLDGTGRIVLEEGDSVYFDAKLRHSYRNMSNSETAFVSVVTPPSM